MDVDAQDVDIIGLHRRTNHYTAISSSVNMTMRYRWFVPHDDEV
jgi:hypothetical protein